MAGSFTRPDQIRLDSLLSQADHYFERITLLRSRYVSRWKEYERPMKQAQKMQAEMMKSQESLRTKILKRAPAAVL